MKPRQACHAIIKAMYLGEGFYPIIPDKFEQMMVEITYLPHLP
jgi:hypothetical protein